MTKLKELNDLKKQIKTEDEKKTANEKRLNELRNELVNAAFFQLRDEKILANGVFEVRPEGGYRKSWEMKAYASDFGDAMVEIVAAYDEVSMSMIKLIPKEYENAPYAVREMIRVMRTPNGIRLNIGEDVELGYLKAVVKDYGLRVDISRINEAIKSEGSSWGTMSKLKTKLIMSGAAEGLPMCDLAIFSERYLEVEEQYARKLHAAFKDNAAHNGLIGHKKLRQDFELMDPFDQELFLEMGRAIFQALLENEKS